MRFILTTIVFLSVVNLIASTIIRGAKKPQAPDNVCTTPGCHRAAAAVIKNIDESVDPCDNFYKFACGKFQKDMTIDNDKPTASYFLIIYDKIAQQMMKAYTEPTTPNEIKPFSMTKKYYNLCLDMPAIEADGLKTMSGVLKEVGGWPVLEGQNWHEEQFDWMNTTRKLRAAGLNYQSIISIFAGKDAHNSSRNIINIDEPGPGMAREYLIQGTDNNVVKAYYELFVDVAVSFGADRASAVKEMKEVVEFQIELAKITLSSEERRDPTLMTNIMTVSELQKTSPEISWLVLINNVIHLSDVTYGLEDTVDLGVPKFITKLGKLLSETPKRVLANYLINRAIADNIGYLTQDLRTKLLRLVTQLSGITQQEPRAIECMKLTSANMPIATAALYARNYFNDDSKKNAAELVSNLQATFLEILKQVDWMDEITKSKAIEKANSMYAHIGYPQELLDDKKLEGYYADMKPFPDNFLISNLNIQKFKNDLIFKKLRQSVDRMDWTEHSNIVTINAYYDGSENSIRFPAGILQGVFFDSERPHYMNYGSMGYVAGHEITHGFDDQGRHVDAKGELVDWWETETKETFLEKAKCIIEQYGNFTVPEIQLNINGVNTLGENIADNGGIKEAYLAYKAWVLHNAEEPSLPGLKYTPKQLFWISAANFWCDKVRDEYLRVLVLTNEHAPSEFRVLGTFRNSEYFAKDFNCPVGSNMNPEHKCQVW